MLIEDYYETTPKVEYILQAMNGTEWMTISKVIDEHQGYFLMNMLCFKQMRVIRRDLLNK